MALVFQWYIFKVNLYRVKYLELLLCYCTVTFGVFGLLLGAAGALALEASAQAESGADPCATTLSGCM